MKIPMMIAAGIGALMLTACDSNDDHFEEAGEQIDKTMDDVKDGTEDAGDELERAADDIKDSAEDIADDVEDATDGHK